MSFLVLLIVLAISAIPSLAVDEGYGEDETALGQYVDSFEDMTGISVNVSVERNVTLNTMELNYASPSTAYLDLTMFTEVDPGNDMTVTVTRNTWDTMTRNVNNYLYYDFGVNVIQDFYYEYTFSVSDIEAGDGSNAGIMSSISVSNVLGNVVTMRANDVIMSYIHQESANDDRMKISILEYSGGGLQNVQASPFRNIGTYYMIFSRVGTFCKLEVWSDPGHTALLDNLTFTATGGDDYRYLQAGASFGGASDPNDHSTGYTELYWNGSTSGGYIATGYFTSTDYLASPIVNGSAIVHMANTTIPTNTGITLEFSEDNSTWVLNDWAPLFGGFESIDLRDLNYSAGYFTRHNLSTSDPAVTPRVYQARLISTIGNISIGIPGNVTFQNVTGTWIRYNLTIIDVIVGTHDSGDVNSTLDLDGDLFNCSEVVGAPGYIVSMNWTGVDSNAGCLWVVINTWYDGNQAHDIDIELYNHTSLAWVGLGHILDGVAFDWFNVSVYGLRIPLDFINGGEVWGRLIHVSPGNMNHDIHIDYLKLHAFIPSDVTPTITTAGVVDVTPFIAIGLILALAMYLLADRVRK